MAGDAHYWKGMRLPDDRFIYRKNDYKKQIYTKTISVFAENGESSIPYE